MDGYEVARVLREDAALASVYLVALTGYGQKEDQRRALAAGFDQHLTKPVDYADLRRVFAALPVRA
jgi:CheY-like chemotaxis protein